MLAYPSLTPYRTRVVGLSTRHLVLVQVVRRSRVIRDFGGYRRLFAYLAAFGREGIGGQCGGRGGCIGL